MSDVKTASTEWEKAMLYPMVLATARRTSSMEPMLQVLRESCCCRMSELLASFFGIPNYMFPRLLTLVATCRGVVQLWHRRSVSMELSWN